MILFQITGLRLIGMMHNFGITAISKSLSYFKINHVISKMSKNSSTTTKPAREKHERERPTYPPPQPQKKLQCSIPVEL